MMNGNGSYKHEIQEEQDIELNTNGVKRKLGDFIPIYLPAVERGLIDQSRQEKRFFDFLRATPSRDWFIKSFFHRNAGHGNEPAGDQEQTETTEMVAQQQQQQRSRRFRVPFVRKINWSSMMKSFKKWIKDPSNIAMFIWLVLVIIGLIVLGLVMLGVFPDGEDRRKNWEEVLNQILNALFMIMCVYQQPKLFHHLVIVNRWRPEDKLELRKTYCKDTTPKPHERAHLLFVVVLLQITFVSQYVLCGLYWGYSRKARPDWAVNTAIGVGIGAPIIAAVWTVKSPLGRRYESETNDEEVQGEEAAIQLAADTELRLYNQGVVVTSPQWIGGLFHCCDDVTVACLSFFCMFCVFGWNVERLGFGNMYLHVITFMLFCIAPFLVFSATALSIDDDTVRYAMGIIGILLCFFGLLYGGFWRIQMRKKFKLPGNPCCCGYPSATDCAKWFFCWSCALAQEVRTGNFYDIEEDSFYRRVTEPEDGRLVIGEGGIEMSIGTEYTPRSHSCPPKLGTSNGVNQILPLSFERAATYGHVHVMQPPLPNLINMQQNYQ